MTIFNGWHWPTFFLSLIIFTLAVNFWNIVKYTILKNQALARARRANANLQGLLKKLKTENQEIGGLIEKLKPPKS